MALNDPREQKDPHVFFQAGYAVYWISRKLVVSSEEEAMTVFKRSQYYASD